MTVGGSLTFDAFDMALQLSSYLVFASFGYAMITTGAMMLVGCRMAHVIERKNQGGVSERSSPCARLHTSAPRPLRPKPPSGAHPSVSPWRRSCAIGAACGGSSVRTTLVSHGNTLLAPLVGLILCVPQLPQSRDVAR